MDVKNLATIFAPSILRPPDHTKLQASLTESDAQISIVETMIESVDDIFVVGCCHSIIIIFHSDIERIAKSNLR
jgi:hypothetical protein